MGDLLLVYKKVQRLAGLCSRVAELLESITDRNSDKEEREGKEGAKAAAEKRVAVPASSTCVSAGAGGESGVLMQPSCIVFKDVSINTPDKRLLIDQLDLQLSPGTSLVITGKRLEDSSCALCI